MRFARSCGVAVVVLAACAGDKARAAEAPQAASAASAITPAAGKKPLARPVGIEKRTPWTASRIVGSPDPPLPYDVERVFASLKFNQPVDIKGAPGSDRLFVVEQGGKIFSFPNRPDVKTPVLVIDAAQKIAGAKQVYSLAFHPDFKKNRYCYLCCIRDTDLKDGTRVSRFKVSQTDPPTIDPASEQLVITWLSGGHNGCCLAFGPDGCLYISTGDGAGPSPPDPKRTGQDLGDLLSSILRIDVDHADAGRNYRIPADNPFTSVLGARPEVWAYGLRNPWRMSFDRKTGDLWVGDVGWELWEMLDRIQRGGNYGWSVMEGRQPANPEWVRGPTPILPPTIDHPHSEAASITDGTTYYGSRLPELAGTHVYGDYVTGKIWGFRWEGGKVAAHRELAATTLKIVSFGEDNSGELYLLDHGGGTIHRLARNPNKAQSAAFPRRLSETGLFASVADQSPAPGVIPYSINAEPWEDGAVAERFVALPGESRINTAVSPWQFPKGAVLAKTLSVAAPTGLRRRMETQVLHFTGTDWRAYTYRWNDDQTDAALVDAAGEDRMIESVMQAADVSTSVKRTKQTWHYPSRAECLRCHNPWAGPALGFQPFQLNRDRDYGGGGIASQLDTFFHIRLCEPPVPANQRTALASPRDQSADVNQRARSYLHTNCAHCHRVNAGSSVLAQMQFDLPLEQTAMVAARPTQGSFGIHAAQVVAPGDPYRSVLLYRMSKLGSGRMPYIGSQQIDAQGVALIHQWIKEMPAPAAKGDSPAASESAAKLRQEETRRLEQLCAAKNAPVAVRSGLVDQLLSNTSGALMLLRAIEAKKLSAETGALVVQKGTSHGEVQIRDLFERFVPEEKRVKRLGSVVRAADILRLPGDASRGKQVFFETAGVQCKNCHRVQKVGRDVGPDLDQVGKKYDRAQLLESMLEPSKSIDPKFATYVVETTSGRVHTGLLVSKDARQVVLKDAQSELIRIAAADVERMAGQSRSLMPELLLRDLTAQQVADLLAYLASLR